MRQPILAAMILCLCSQVSHAQNPAAPSPPAPAPASQSPAPRNDYADPDTWLCRPDLPPEKNACNVDLTTTVIAANAKTTIERFSPNLNAPIDCFYVYPTVSTDPGGNATMTAAPEERAVIRAQFARFASQCRLYAPLYRQATLTAIFAAAVGHPMPIDRDMVYDDVLDAWNYYLAHDNHGRGVVLIGHSQGAGVLTLLIKNEIDGKPIQSRLVSALLLGTNLAVPKGKDVGGRFDHIPLCRSAAQTGCVISYVSFRATQPPTPDSRFGHVSGEDMLAACVNPAALAGGSGELHAYLGTKGVGFIASEATPDPWLKSGAPITTPFVSVPGLLTAECLNNEHGSYLAITVHADPEPPALSSERRTTTITGDVVVRGQVVPEWGLHLIDVSLAMGNLLDIVARESTAFITFRMQQQSAVQTELCSAVKCLVAL
jgi:hypothetical protein